MVTKTTKKSTKSAASRAPKRPVAAKKTGRTANKRTKCCKIDETSLGHRCFCAVLCMCCAITAIITAALIVGAQISNEALAKNLEADRQNITPAVDFEGNTEAAE